MGYNKGFFGQTNKKKDTTLVKRIVALINEKDYTEDEMSAKIRGYIARYNDICSLTDKMRYHMKMHLEKHKEIK